MPPGLEAIRESTRAWLAAFDPVGLSERELVEAAGAQGVQIRVISRDGRGLIVRADLRPSRVNVEVVGGLVTRVDGVG